MRKARGGMSWARKLGGSWPIARKWRGSAERKNNWVEGVKQCNGARERNKSVGQYRRVGR